MAQVIEADGELAADHLTGGRWCRVDAIGRREVAREQERPRRRQAARVVGVCFDGNAIPRRAGAIPERAPRLLKAQDCMCLFGCVYLPQTKTTATRRQMQHTALCTPNKDGMGNPCPVDDCVQPGPIACINGTCKAAPGGDAGPAQ